MILVMRIVGQASLKGEFDETLKRMNIHRKLACTFINKDDSAQMGMLAKATNMVAYGEITDELAAKIIEARGQGIDGKPVGKDTAKIIEGIKKGEWKIKKFFRLHPPRGGFKKSTKLGYPQGVLGHNKDIAKLVERML